MDCGGVSPQTRGCDIRQRHRLSICIDNCPGSLSKGRSTTVQMMASVLVSIEPDFHAVDATEPISNPVRERAGDCPEVGTMVRVAGRTLKPKNDPAERACTVGNQQVPENGSPSHDPRRGATRGFKEDFLPKGRSLPVRMERFAQRRCLHPLRISGSSHGAGRRAR